MNGYLAQLLEYLAIPFRVFKIVCFCMGLSVLVTALAVGIYVDRFFHTLPDVQSMTFEQLRTLAQKKVARKMNHIPLFDKDLYLALRHPDVFRRDLPAHQAGTGGRRKGDQGSPVFAGEICQRHCGIRH